MSEPRRYRPVLILGASPRVSVPVARALARHGIAVEVASFQAEEAKLNSRAIRGFHRLPDWRGDPTAFGRSLIALIQAKQFDTIFAASDPPLAALADLYDDLIPLLHVGCPVPSVVRSVLDKSMTLETAERSGIRIPFTCIVSSVAELEGVAPQLRFPLIAKPMRKGAAAFRIFYFRNLPELRKTITASTWGPVLLQEYCPGVGVGVEVLMHKGECLAKFQHRRLKEAPASGGVAILAIAEEPDPVLLQQSIALLRALEWEGVAMVEYRVDRQTGNSVLMEVNGRYWGSVSFPIAAGVNFPYYHWQVLHGQGPDAPEQYPIGMRWRWAPGYIDRMQSIIFRGVEGIGPKPSLPRELSSAVADLSPFTKEALWSWSDPLPFFAELLRMARSFASVFLKSVWHKLMPSTLRTQIEVYSRTLPQARIRYSELRIREAIGFPVRNGESNATIAAKGARSVLFVCYGNLMRSPMAEAILKSLLAERGIDDVEVQSAGIHARPGREAHPWALAVSREFGVLLHSHRAQVTTPELIASMDLVLAMDLQNLAELQTLYPEARSKLFLLGAYADGRLRNRAIPDPYRGGIETTRRCYSALIACVQNLANEIGSAQREKEVSVTL